MIKLDHQDPAALARALAATCDTGTLRAVEAALTTQITVLETLPGRDRRADAHRLRSIRHAFGHAQEIQAREPVA